MALPIAALGIAAAPSIIRGIGGLFGIGSGRRRAKANIRPIASVNENYLKNVALAENMGRVGLPQEQYNRGIQNIGRNQSAAFTSLSRSANPMAGIQGLLRASNDATLGLDVQDANARLNNQRFAFGQRQNLANEQNRVWDWNKRARYNEEAQAAGQEIAAGKQNAFGALTDISQLGSAALGAGVFDGAGQASTGAGTITNYLPNAEIIQPYSGTQPRFFPTPKIQTSNYNRYNGFGSFNNLRGY